MCWCIRITGAALFIIIIAWSTVSIATLGVLRSILVMAGVMAGGEEVVWLSLLRVDTSPELRRIQPTVFQERALPVECEWDGPLVERARARPARPAARRDPRTRPLTAAAAGR
jgi:hypothetical protein